MGGHLSCFQILAIECGGVGWEQISFWHSVFLFSSDTFPEVELLGHMVVLFLIFEEPPYSLP